MVCSSSRASPIRHPRGALAELTKLARRTFETYRTPADESARIAFLLGCSRDKISVAREGGDMLKAAFVTGTSSWQIMEGLWAANNRPLPPNSSVRPHLGDLSAGPPDVSGHYSRLFLGDTETRFISHTETWRRSRRNV